MNRMEFVYTLTLLRDILPSATKLSQIAQTRDVDISLYAQEIEVSRVDARGFWTIHIVESNIFKF
jgi:hypothetical protein